MKIGQLDQKWDSTEAKELETEECFVKKEAHLRTGGLIKKEA